MFERDATFGLNTSVCLGAYYGIMGSRRDVMTAVWKTGLEGVWYKICIMLCADHGPCVSGAHNTIVTARVGKDLVSSLVSGLLTIGPRFDGAIDDAARYFKNDYDKALTPYEFVESMKKKGIRVPGIGHRTTIILSFLATKVCAGKIIHLMFQVVSLLSLALDYLGNPSLIHAQSILAIWKTIFV